MSAVACSWTSFFLESAFVPPTLLRPSHLAGVVMGVKTRILVVEFLKIFILPLLRHSQPVRALLKAVWCLGPQRWRPTCRGTPTVSPSACDEGTRNVQLLPWNSNSTGFEDLQGVKIGLPSAKEEGKHSCTIHPATLSLPLALSELSSIWHVSVEKLRCGMLHSILSFLSLLSKVQVAQSATSRQVTDRFRSKRHWHS